MRDERRHSLAASRAQFRRKPSLRMRRFGTLQFDGMEYELTLTDVADDALRKLILAPLLEYNASQAGPSQGRPMVIAITDQAGSVIGGLWGHTGYEWLFTQLLVVPASLRGRGVGSEIMRLAEREAVQRGCHNAWLDTFEFQARGFYERLGYECFGELPDYPKGHARYFMKKALSTSSTGA